MNEIPLELVSNFISIVIVVALVYKYIQYKKRIDVLEELDNLKKEDNLTQQDKKYILDNEKEYKEKALKAEANIKIMNPIFILIAGILIVYLPFSEAMIHLNVVVVAFLFIQLDRIHKKNTYTLLHELKKEN